MASRTRWRTTPSRAATAAPCATRRILPKAPKGVPSEKGATTPSASFLFVCARHGKSYPRRRMEAQGTPTRSCYPQPCPGFFFEHTKVQNQKYTKFNHIIFLIFQNRKPATRSFLKTDVCRSLKFKVCRSLHCLTPSASFSGPWSRRGGSGLTEPGHAPRPRRELDPRGRFCFAEWGPRS